MLKKVLLSFSFMATSVAFWSCPGSLENPDQFRDGGAGGDCVGLISSDRPKSVMSKCIGCHGAGSTPPDLSTAALGAYLRMTNSAECTGKTMAEAVVLKITSPVTMCGAFTQVMPTGSSLTAAEIKCFSDYVDKVKAGTIP